MSQPNVSTNGSKAARSSFFRVGGGTSPAATNGKAAEDESEQRGSLARVHTGRPLDAADAYANGAAASGADEGGSEDLRLLCDQAAELVGRLPGNLRRVALRGTYHAVEIEWHEEVQPAAGADAPPPPAGSRREVAPPPGAGRERIDHGSPSREANVPGLPADDQPPGAGGGAADEHSVVAPLVGTFYRAPEPGAPPFVEVGDLVEPGQTVGIVEAMKLMNPVVSETAGRISAVHVGNGEPVEFGQPLVAVFTAVRAG